MSKNTTIKPKTHDEWLEVRKNGIGSSEIGTILGLNPFETPYQLWKRKRGETEPVEENFAMKAGHYLEDAVSRFFADETGATIIKNSAIDFIVQDNEKPFLQVSPDRYFKLDGKKGICECKTTQRNITSDDIPKHWYCQLQYQLGVTGLSVGALAWLTQGRSFGCRMFDFDPELYDFIVESAERFWLDCIIGGKEPDPVNSEDIISKFDKSEGEIVADGELLRAIVDLNELKEKNKEIDAKISELEERVKMKMGQKEALVNDSGLVLATWKTAKGRMTFDSSKFKSDHPEMYDQYTKEGSPSRRFLLK